MVAWREMGGKLGERMVRVVLVVLETYPVPFAEFVPFFLELFVKVGTGMGLGFRPGMHGFSLFLQLPL